MKSVGAVQEGTQIVPPNFNQAIYGCACVVEGEEVLTRRPGEQGSKNTFLDTLKIPNNERNNPERTTPGEDFFSAKEEQVQVVDRRSWLREGLVSLWRMDIHQAVRMCGDRQVVRSVLCFMVQG